MIGKKINQLATELAPVSTDLTIIGDPISGVSKKITLAQLGAIFSGAVSFYDDLASFPATGDINVIYCAKDTQKLYLWSGSAYVEVFPSQSLLDTYQLRSEKGVSNGYASLDSGGKVPISQLPSSIMEYKGMWNAATNTPTLANGTGDTGDVYICNVAGTVDFGAGPITFAVGDYVIYSGSIWQRSSGAVGTVTSVAVSRSGDALAITGSPITTSGTINIGFAGTSGQYINGAGSLTTFPTLTGFVPYTGATTNVDLGTHSLSAYDLIINHTSGSGVAASITKGGNGEALTVVKSSGSGKAASITGGVTLLDELHLNTDLADTYIASASNWNAAYNDKINSAAVTGTTTKTLTLTQQDGGTITASWTDDNTDAVTSVFGRTGAVVATSGDYNTSQVTENTNLYFTNARAIASTLTGYTSGAGTISATDTILSAIQKLNGNIGALTTGVSSVNGLTGAVTLTTSNIAEGTNLYYTEARVNANTNVAANTAARHNAVTIGTANGLSLSTQVLSLALASGSTTGALSSTDWTTFNNKQSALTNPVTGTGTTNYLPKFTGTSTIGNSVIQEASSNIGIGGTPSYKLDIQSTTDASLLQLISSATANNTALRIGIDGNNAFINASGGSTGILQLRTYGTTRATLDASGNLGLGVTPSAWSSAFGSVLQFKSAGSNGGGALTGSGGSNFRMFANTFYDGSYKYIVNGTATQYEQDGYHAWYTAPSGTAGNAISFTQAMTLDASGNLGLGNTSPTIASGYRSFIANGTSGTIIRTQVNGTTAFDIQADPTITYLWENRNVPIVIGTNGSTRVTIASTGAATFSSDVTSTSSTGAFAVVGAGSSNTNAGSGRFVIYDTTNNRGWGLQQDASYKLNFWHYNGGWSSVANISGSGAATFSSSVTATGGVYAGDSKFFNSVQLTDSLGGTCQGFLWTDAANTLKLGTGTVAGGNVKMTILSSGNVGIGTASPAALLHIEKASQDNILAVIGQSGYEGALFLSGAGSGKDANIVVGNGRNLEFHTSSSTTPVVDGTERMRITSSGNVEINTGSIKTGEPDTGYGRAAFKIGSRQSGSATGTGGYIPISIDGTVYFINLFTSTP